MSSISPQLKYVKQAQALALMWITADLLLFPPLVLFRERGIVDPFLTCLCTCLSCTMKVANSCLADNM